MNFALSCRNLNQRLMSNQQVQTAATDTSRASANGSLDLPLQDSTSVMSNSSVWEILPNELLHNILGKLPFQDLLICQKLNRRTAEVIRDNLLLPQAYCKQFQPEPLEQYFSVEEYDREIRSWLMGAGMDSEILWLDSLKAHEKFSKALFYTVSKTKVEAEYWDVAVKWQTKLDQYSRLVYFSQCGYFRITPDGTALAFFNFTEKKLHAVTTQSGTPSIEKYRVSIDSELFSVDLSLNGKTLALVFKCGTVQVFEREQNCWLNKYQGDYPQLRQFFTSNALCHTGFSDDGQYFLIAFSSGTLRVLGKKDSTWGIKMNIDTRCYIDNVLFVSSISVIAITSHKKGLSVIDIESNKLVAQYKKWDCVHRRSPCGHSLAVGSSGVLSAIITCSGGEWRIYPIVPQYSRLTLAWFSPDGQHLAILFRQYDNSLNMHVNIRVITFDGASWQESGYIETKSWVHSLHFSPDSRVFFVSSSSSYPNFAVFDGGCWHFRDSWATGTLLKLAHVSPTGQEAIDCCSCIDGAYITFVRRKAGEWLVAHKMKRDYSPQVRFLPDNRNVLVVSNNEIELLEIKPKNNNHSSEKGLT